MLQFLFSEKKFIRIDLNLHKTSIIVLDGLQVWSIPRRPECSRVLSAMRGRREPIRCQTECQPWAFSDLTSSIQTLQTTLNEEINKKQMEHGEKLSAPAGARGEGRAVFACRRCPFDSVKQLNTKRLYIKRLCLSWSFLYTVYPTALRCSTRDVL